MRHIKFKKNGECIGSVSKMDRIIFERTQECVKPRIKEVYLDGDFVESDLISLAVVGSRKISSYGRRVCDVVVGELAAAGVTIVSGLMYGVDQAAHNAALNAGGRTIAILGYGMNVLSTNKHTEQLSAKILQTKAGVIVSEYVPSHPPTQYTFPTRNRIVAGISMATLVIEAGAKSGSKITAGFAADYGKDVFVIPGPIFSSVSKGKHALLKEGAIPVDSAKDILDYLGILSIQKERAKRDLKGLQKQIYDEINDSGEIRLDELIEGLCVSEGPDDSEDSVSTITSPTELSAVLTSLELEGLIKKKSDGRLVPV